MKKLSIIIISILLMYLYCSKNVKKIPDNSPSGNSKNSSSYEDNDQSDLVIPEKHIGSYIIELSGYQAVLDLTKKNEKVSGTIVFKNWGNGKPQKLKKLRINGNKIYFIRSVETQEEMTMYNSNRMFKQRFHGIFSVDGKNINGHYIDLGDESIWIGKKIR